MGRRQEKPDWNTLAPYVGRWVAMVRGCVVGVGWTETEARRAAKRSRPKEDPQVMFVSAVGGSSDESEST
jgi:hypothetical protein